MYNGFGDAPMPTFGNVGWICPKCGRVYAPTTPSCFVCGSEDNVATSNKIEEKSPSLLDILNPKLFGNHNFLNQNQPKENKDSSEKQIEQEFTDQESQNSPDGGNKRMITYGEIHRKATKVIPRDSISDYRPASYSKGFQLTNSDYINSIVIWLENGDEIIYTAKESHDSNMEKES